MPAAPTQHTDLVDRPCLLACALAGGCLWGRAKTIAAKLTQRQLWIGGGGWLTGDKNTIKRLNQAVLNRRTSWPNTMRSIGFDRFLRLSIAAKRAKEGARHAAWTGGRKGHMRPWLSLEWLISSRIYLHFFLSRPRQRRKFHSLRAGPHLQHATSGGMPKIQVAFLTISSIHHVCKVFWPLSALVLEKLLCWMAQTGLIYNYVWNKLKKVLL